jgi:hypothetical protein
LPSHGNMQLADFALISDPGTADAHPLSGTCAEYSDDSVMYKISRGDVVL